MDTISREEAKATGLRTVNNNCTNKPLAPAGEMNHHDMSMIHNLLSSNSRYQIPTRLRNKVIEKAEELMESEENRDVATGLKVILEADKRNIDIVKIALPKKTEVNIREQSTEELQSLLKELLINNPQLIPVIQ